MPRKERRVGRYLKPGVKATAPGVLFTIATVPSVHTVGADESRMWLEWGGAAACVSRWKRGRWTPEETASFDIAEDLHRWLEARCDRSAANYVIVPDGQETVAQIRLWDRIDEGNSDYLPPGTIDHVKARTLADSTLTVFRRQVQSPRCFALDYTRHGVRWKWFGGRQFFGEPEELLAVATGEPWATGAEAARPGESWARSPEQRALLWLHLFQKLSGWWRTSAKAPFGSTAAALSLGMLRSHIDSKTLCSHTHEQVLPMERDACFGGMARTFYFGDVLTGYGFDRKPHGAPPLSEYGSVCGPMSHFDVRSMYPWLLREERFPLRLKEYHTAFPARDLFDLAEGFGVVARVQIETEVAEYPERVGGRIYYRRGRFTTTLTGPELLALRADGKVLQAHAVAVYYLGRPFREAAAALIDMREKAREEGELAWEMFAKSVGNGLGGKLAQKNGAWVVRKNHAALYRFGEWSESGGKKGRPRKFRAIAGITWEWEPDSLGAGPYTASFAYLAAYGRLHLRSIRDVCPERSVLSCDTDGLWVLPSGLCALRTLTGGHDARAGVLRCTTSSDFGRFFGPRHYCTAEGWVLSGFAAPSVSPQTGMVDDTQRFTGTGGPLGVSPRGTSVRRRRCALKVESHGLKIGSDGWAEPTRRR